jgi:hypothetical protein
MKKRKNESSEESVSMVARTLQCPTMVNKGMQFNIIREEIKK